MMGTWIIVLVVFFYGPEHETEAHAAAVPIQVESQEECQTTADDVAQRFQKAHEEIRRAKAVCIEVDAEDEVKETK